MFCQYVDILCSLAGAIRATTLAGEPLTLAETGDWLREAAEAAHREGKRTLFIGNGGSATIASHMAVDYSKNANLRAQALNDSAFLTCLGNDLGYENVFSKQLELFATPGDLLVAISSSGRSPNILGAVAQARRIGCRVLTLSGFQPDNPLRRVGDVNVYVPSDKYGYVELLHLTFLHAVSDFSLYGGLPQPVGEVLHDDASAQGGGHAHADD